MKTFLIVLFMIFLVSIVLADDFYGIKTTVENNLENIKENWTIKLNLKDFNENPEEYLGKRVKFYGEYVNYYYYFTNQGKWAKRFIDYEGYKIEVISNRDFQKNRRYNIEGIIIYDEVFTETNKYAILENEQTN